MKSQFCHVSTKICACFLTDAYLSAVCWCSVCTRYDLISNKKTFDGFLSIEVESKPVKIRSIIKSTRTDQQIGQLLS